MSEAATGVGATFARFRAWAAGTTGGWGVLLRCQDTHHHKWTFQIVATGTEKCPASFRKYASIMEERHRGHAGFTVRRWGMDDDFPTDRMATARRKAGRLAFALLAGLTVACFVGGITFLYLALR